MNILIRMKSSNHANQVNRKNKNFVHPMVSVTHKPAEADLLEEKNTISWLISQTGKFQRTGC
jgi:hypothetical protein